MAGRRGGTNRITNPSFETNTTGWSTLVTTTVARSTNHAWVGTASLLATMGTAGGNSAWTVADLTGVTLTGVPHLISARARRWAATGTTIIASYLVVNYTDATNQVTLVGPVVGTGAWQEVVLPPLATNPAKTISNIAFHAAYHDAIAPSPYEVYIDGVDLRIDEPDCDDYIDGDQGAGYAWTGTVHASTSTRAAIVVPEAPSAVDTRSGKNWIPNPSAEVNTTGIRPSGGATAVRTNEQAMAGTSAFKLIVPATTSAGIGMNADLTGVALTGVPHMLRAKVRLWVAAGVTIPGAVLQIGYADGYPYWSTGPIVGTGGWQTVTLPPIATDPARTIVEVILYLVFNTTAAASAYVVYADGLDLRIDEPDIDSYIDGSLGPRYRWDGAAHNAPSLRDEQPVTSSPTPGPRSLVLFPLRTRVEANGDFAPQVVLQTNGAAVRFDWDRPADTGAHWLDVWAWNPASSSWYQYLPVGPLSSAGHTLCTIDPRFPNPGNGIQAIPPTKLRIQLVPNSAGITATSSVSATLDRSGGDYASGAFSGVTTFALFPKKVRTAAEIGQLRFMPVTLNGARGVRFDLDVEAIADNSIAIVVDGWDPAKQAWTTEATTGLPLSAPGHAVHHVDPRIPASATGNQREPFSKLRVRLGGAPSTVTCSVSCTLGA